MSDEVAATVAARLADPEQVARSRQLPMRFLSAYRAAPSLRWAWALERALDASLANVPSLPGRTLVRAALPLRVYAVRIVSLLPAATDLVAELGLLPQLVGRTHECDWPPGEIDAVPVVIASEITEGMDSREISDTVHHGSSIYTLDTNLLQELKPDVVLTQDLCDVCALSYHPVSEAVRKLDADVTVLSLEPRTLNEVLDCLCALGEVLGVEDVARQRIDGLNKRLEAVKAKVAGKSRPRVAAIEWLDPVWPAGHWVPEQIAYAGGTSLLAEPGEHTRPIEWRQVVEAEPDILVLMPCGFTPAKTQQELARLKGFDVADRRYIVDGPAYFNRPGPRVVDGVELLARLFHQVD